MFKVMIIDDSPQIVHYLCNLIDWEDYDFILTGSYTNAHSLLADAVIDVPDVVFTDIAMPVMDGVDLATRLREFNSDIIVIFISGHSEFEYAKKALELHVFDYLLKPVQLPQLRQLMEKLLKELKAKELQRYKQRLEESQKLFHYKASHIHYLSRLLFHAGSEERILTEMLRLGFPLPDSYSMYIASVFPYISADSYIYSLLERDHMGVQITPLMTDTEYAAFLILYNNDDGQFPVADLLSSFCIDVKTQLDTDVTIGYSSSSSSFSRLPVLFSEANSALDAAISAKPRVPILSFSDIHFEDPIPENDTNISIYREMVVNMLEYIHNNYMHDISTKDVTRQVYLSSNYANSFFAKEYGMTVSDYLRQYRIKKGMQLLVETDENVTRIAEMVGYGSKTAFYLAFKRYTNLSPTEYRQQYSAG